MSIEMNIIINIIYIIPMYLLILCSPIHIIIGYNIFINSNEYRNNCGASQRSNIISVSNSYKERKYRSRNTTLLSSWYILFPYR